MKALTQQVPSRRRARTYSRGKLIACIVIGLVGGSLFYDFGPRIWSTQESSR